MQFCLLQSTKINLPMDSVFVQISLIILAATFVSVIVRLLKQPLIVGYVLTGLLLSRFLVFYPQAEYTMEAFSQMGIAILLFIVGLHLSPKEVKNFGFSVLRVGLAQILFTGLFAYFLSQLVGLSLIPSIYISVALTFSSTIVVLKLVSDKKELEKLYGRLVIGILLLQDIVAALAIIVASAFSVEGVNALTFVLPFVLGVAVTTVLAFVSIKLLPKFASFFAKSQELLFLFSLGWGFGIAILFEQLGLSMEIGALIAGVLLSMSPYATEISSRLRPLRDFFVVMFFVLIGTQVEISSISQIYLPLIVFGIFILVVKPLLILAFLGHLGGYKKKTSFMGAISLAQISEFSLILGLLGLKVGHIDSNIVSLLTLLLVISIVASTYLVIFGDKLYLRLNKYLKFFERKRRPQKEFDLISSYDVVLFGCARAGYDFIESFKYLKQKFLCIDFDPEMVDTLTKSNINCRYGDAEDGEFLDEINITGAKMVISTIPDFEANMFLLNKIRNVEERVIAVMFASDVKHALSLYENSADYVIIPHFIGGRLISKMAKDVNFDDRKFNAEKKKHIKYLQDRLDLGHS